MAGMGSSAILRTFECSRTCGLEWNIGALFSFIKELIRINNISRILALIRLLFKVIPIGLKSSNHGTVSRGSFEVGMDGVAGHQSMIICEFGDLFFLKTCTSTASPVGWAQFHRAHHVRSL